jgi:2,4-dienoyl-CoA reductase-like NADH-dependent reductase (Old Yellow Enzyme family)/thioredoxin reductase
MTTKLFSKGRIGSIALPNRIVMTAMGIAQSALDGSVTDTEVAFYRERANGGVGLIITECMIVDWESGRGNLHQTAVCDDGQIAGLARLADSVHQGKSAIVGQVYHPGRQGFTHVNGSESQPAPSAVADAMTQQPVHEMSLTEISALVEKFAEAARRLKQAHFDGVEVHAAHGYLLNSFLSPYANFRSDEYGGSTEGRCRIVVEIIKRIREVCGEEFAILVRISVSEYLEMAGKPGEGIGLDEGIAIAKLLEASGCDALDVSCGIYETMNTAWEPFSYDEGWKSHLAAAVKAEVSVPVIGVSVYRNPAFAEQMLLEEKLDFVGSARTHFADPYWASKAHAVLETAVDADGDTGAGAASEAMGIRRCVSCLACMETLVAADQSGMPAGCAINPRTARELEKLPTDGDNRRVIVVGAGPAGLEAAVTAAERGFSVILLEKEAVIGGQLNYASKPPGKDKLNWMLEYYNNRIAALGIDLRLGISATPEMIAALAAGSDRPNQAATSDEAVVLPEAAAASTDSSGSGGSGSGGSGGSSSSSGSPKAAVILAVGSVPVLPKTIPGLDGDNVYAPPAVLSGQISLEGKEVVVVGSGMTGIETTELLAEQGCRLSLFEMVPDIGPGVYFQNMMDIMPRLAAHDVQLYPSHKLLGIAGDTATFEKIADDKTGEYLEVSADAFVISLGARPLTEFVKAVQSLVPSAIVIGDSSKAGRIMDATLSGWEAAKAISAFFL